MKAFVLALGLLIIGIALPAHDSCAALAGTSTGYGIDQAGACSSANGQAALDVEANRAVETFGRKNPSVRVRIGSCNCSQSAVTKGWTCIVSWGLDVS
jgi:hypothetical protein